MIITIQPFFPRTKFRRSSGSKYKCESFDELMRTITKGTFIIKHVNTIKCDFTEP